MPPLKCISPHKSAPCLKNFEPEDFFKLIEQNQRLLTSSLKGDLVGLYRCVTHAVMFWRLISFKLHEYKAAVFSFAGVNVEIIAFTLIGKVTAFCLELYKSKTCVESCVESIEM